MKRISLYIICALACAAASAQSQNFYTTVDAIVQANPEYNARVARITADRLALARENNLPDPEISIENLFGKGDNKYNIGVSQGFDWPGLYKARAASVDRATAVSMAALAVDQAEARVEVAEILLDIIATRKKIDNYDTILQQITSMHTLYRNLLEKGDVTVVNVNKLSIELADYQQMLADERQNLNDKTAALKAMTSGLDIDAIVASLTDFPIMQLHDKSVYEQAMAENSPQLKLLEAQLDADRAGIDAARLAGYPGLSVGYRFSHEDGQAYNGFSLGVTVPLWSTKGAKKAADAAIRATQLEMQSASNILTAGIDADYAKAVSLKERIDSYGRALTMTDNLGILQCAFDSRQITLTDYIQDVRYFTEARTRLYDLQQQYFTTLISLDRYNSKR